MIRSNFHTHTTFCDGQNTPEEMVVEAIKRGYVILGFSGHSYLEFDKDVTMDEKSAAEYRRVVNELKDKYKDSIKILCGVEQDYYSETIISIYDYVIGSVHNVLKDGVFLSVDRSFEDLKENVDKYYDGDFDAFAEDYFELVGDVINKTNADIIGHIDVILKYSEQLGYTPTKRFLTAAEKAVKKLVEFKRPFEINTGAISRKARTSPYPIPEILKMIYDNGGNIVFSSDCHNKEHLECAFSDAQKLAMDIGFTHHGIITETGVEYIPIVIKYFNE